MAGNELTGIERRLVLQYLIDGNTPITVSPLEKPVADGNVHADSSRIFPVALRAEQLTVLDQGIILLKDAPESVQQFSNADVRVQFYFNKLGLYFDTQIKRVSAGLAIVIPAVIRRIVDVEEKKPCDMTAILYYEAGEKTGGMHVTCQFDEQYVLFRQPKWSDVAEPDAARAQSYLERIVAAEKKGDENNTLTLIPVCRYLAHEDTAFTSVQGKIVPPTVLYIDHERIVFGAEKRTISFVQGTEYALRLGFPLPKPLKTREVYVTCLVTNVFMSDDKSKSCAVCRYTSIKEEDTRYLYDLKKQD